MNLFEAVKDAVPTRTAAEHYGIEVKRNGMACCPFHDDRTPSMKVDKRFHCFGCQEDGDVIDFVGKLGTLARLGRAFGIHLVMALQRPDASALPGQIKNNADVRACGRAEMCCPLSSWIMGTLLICRRIFQAGLSPIWMAVQFSRATCFLIWTMKILTLMIRGDMTMAQKKINDYGTGIPYNEVEALARVLLPEIQAFFQSEEGQREFAEWKAHQGTHAA